MIGAVAKRVKPWGFTPNPTRFLKKAGQKLQQNRGFATILIKVLIKLFQKFVGGGAKPRGFNFATAPFLQKWRSYGL